MSGTVDIMIDLVQTHIDLEKAIAQKEIIEMVDATTHPAASHTALRVRQEALARVQEIIATVIQTHRATPVTTRLLEDRLLHDLRQDHLDDPLMAIIEAPPPQVTHTRLDARLRQVPQAAVEV